MVVCLYLWLSNGLVSCPPLMTDETGSDATAPPHSPCLPPTPTTLHSDRHYTVENEDELQHNSMYRNTGASVCSPPPGDSFFFVIFSDCVCTFLLQTCGQGSRLFLLQIQPSLLFIHLLIYKCQLLVISYSLYYMCQTPGLWTEFLVCMVVL